MGKNAGRMISCFTGRVKSGKVLVLRSMASGGAYNSVIHELKEVVQIEQDVRLARRGGCFIFNYTHTEHTDLCARLAGHLKKFIK